MDAEERFEIQNAIRQQRLSADKSPTLREPWEELSKDQTQTRLNKVILYAVTGGLTVIIASGLLFFADAEDAFISRGNLAIMAAMGALGTVIGISGNVFHRFFGKTKFKFNKLINHDRHRKTSQSFDKEEENYILTPVVTVVYPQNAVDEGPASDTYSRDKLAAAKLALLKLDPSKTIRQ